MRRKFLFRMESFGWIALLLVGFLLRMYGIERYGLWIDEITTAQCLNFSLLQILDCHWVQVGSPILFVATNFTHILFGHFPLPAPEWMVRLPEVIAGTLVIPAAWLAARELFGTRGAWLNALLWTFAPTAVAYSQEARMYAWLLLFSNLSAWLVLHMLRRPSWRAGIAFGIIAALNFYSHYLGAFVILAQLLFACVYVVNVKLRAPQKFGRVIVPALCGAITAGALVVPWLPNILKASSGYLLSGSYTRVALTLALLSDAQTWLVFNQVAMPFAALGLIAIELPGAWWMYRHARAGLALVACWLAAPFVFLILRQAGWTAMRYWTVIQPPVYWLLTAGALAITSAIETFLTRQHFEWSRRVPYVFVAVIGIALLMPSLAQFYIDPYESWRFDDWRGAAEELRARSNENDLILAFGASAIYHVMALDYYLGAPRVMEPGQVNGDVVSRAMQTQGRAWGIVYARDEQAVNALRAYEASNFDVVFFKNLALLSPKPQPQETVRASAVRLLNEFREWDDPQFSQALALMYDKPRGENLVLNPQLKTRRNGSPRDWVFNSTRGRVVEQGGEPELQLTSATDDGSVTAAQNIPLAPDRLYVLHFECRHILTRGAQRTYVTFDTPANNLIVFPDGAGYVCPDGPDWHTAEFAFRAPSAAPTARIFLRNAGVGDASWRNLALRELASP